MSVSIFLLAVGVRLFYWQDDHSEIVHGNTSLMALFGGYQREARRMLDGGGILIPREKPVDGDARMIVHPPGYSLILAALYKIAGEGYGLIWILQVVCDALAAVAIFLIALRLFVPPIAFTSGLLAALSPHLAYYSLLLSPDSLQALPVLVAIYIIILAAERPKLRYLIAAGLSIGLACWIRANVMLLAPFLALLVPFFFERGTRLRFQFALIGSMIVVIAPIAIRNFLVFRRFIPVSITAGCAMVEGIGDYDVEKRFDMPFGDLECKIKDVEWHGRPDYIRNMWMPDGIDRDQYRMSRGLSVARGNPRWFLGVMVRRAGFMLSYNKSVALKWPFSSSQVPEVFSEMPFSHELKFMDQDEASALETPTLLFLNGGLMRTPAITDDMTAVWSQTAAKLADDGERISSSAQAFTSDDGQVLKVAGDESDYEDQFASPPIKTDRYFDYILEVPVLVDRGPIAIKVTSVDRRMSLAAASLPVQKPSVRDETAVEATNRAQMTLVQIPFACGNRTQVRMVLSNNGQGAARPMVGVGTYRLLAAGPTSSAYLGYGRRVVHGIQRKLFTTSHLVPLVCLGVILMLIGGRIRTLGILLAVPVYYLIAHSTIHTEYRYILPLHYFLFVLAAVSICCGVDALWQAAQFLGGAVRHKRPAAEQL